jgi:hypothetical protein
VFLRHVAEHEAYRQVRDALVNSHHRRELQDYVLDTDFEWAQYPEEVRRALWAAQPMLERLTEWYFANELLAQRNMPIPYSETPFERFLVLSAAESPQPWMAKRALRELGVEEGITVIDATRRRAQPANMTAIEIDMEDTVESLEEVHRQLVAQRVAAAAAPNGRARTRATPRMLRRHEGSSGNG